MPPQWCAGAAPGGLACVEGTASTWDELAAFDRPLLLEMTTPERFAASVLVVGIEGASAWVATGGGVTEVDLGLLGPAWTGNYQLLWHPPEGFSRPLGLGDNSPVVTQVAALFARLDGQAQALAATRFNPGLEARVRLFQREHGLEDDGVVGLQTLLKLNEVLGIDTTAARARERLAAAGSGVVTR